jgi:exodeoxyribonuclease VII large subunit
MNKTQLLDYVTVDEYLETLNEGLHNFSARVIGEVTEVQLYPGRNYLFFKIKDKDDPALLTCFMWKRDYNLSGVELQVGLEIIISGVPSIYKALGRLSFQTQTVELVGEGQLKKAYDELKARLDKEGLFREERKRPLPSLPQKIGLITSRDGAAIGDFQVNLGRFGFRVTFVDSRVEGQLAVSELLSAIRTLRKKDIEVLVLVRGGGSLESLLSFNNEALIREIVDFPVPVLVGVGHEKDISLVALAADKMVSTPTATAEALNDSWQRAISLVQLDEQRIFSIFARSLSNRQTAVEKSFQTMRRHLQSIFDDFRVTENGFLRVIGSLHSRIAELHRQFDGYPGVLTRSMRALVHRTRSHIFAILSPALGQMEYRIRTAKEGIDFTNVVQTFTNALRHAQQSTLSLEKLLASNNPERQLRLGYSIVRLGDVVIRRVSQVRKGQTVQVRVQDGGFKSDITEIIKEV